jgi:hypothetical protein
MIKRFVRNVTVWMYAASLCTPAAAVWLTFTTVAVLLMAAAEGLAWGYVGYFLMVETFAIYGAIAVGFAAFTLIWILDTTFLTFDVTQNTDGRKDRRKVVFGMFVRGAMVVGSLYVAAPFVTQLVFRRDVDMAIERKNAASITKLRNEITARHDEKITRLKQREMEIQSAIVAESAGHGLSGRFGRGPTVAAMEATLESVRNEREAASEAKARDLGALERNPASYARAAGVALLGEGLAARTQAMEEVAQQPGYSATNRGVKAFLIGLFLAIVVLKIFQPSSVRLYLSQHYQDGYTSYKNGAFDRQLSQAERSDAGPGFTPLRFQEWYDRYVQQERAKQHDEDLQSVMRMHAAETDRLRVLESETRADMQPLLDDIDAALQAVGQLEEELARAEAELADVEKDIQTHEESLQQLDNAIAYPKAVGAGNFVHVLDTRAAWENGLGDLRERRRLLTVQKANLTRRIDVRKDATKIIEESMAAKASTLVDIDKRMAGLRSRLAANIADADQHGDNDAS